MAEIIDNKTRLLGDDLKKEITPGVKVNVVASIFTIYAYEALKKALSSVSELNFVFSSPVFAQKVVAASDKKPKEFIISESFSKTAIYGTSFELKLKNQLAQKSIARGCANWIRQKVHF